MNYRKYLLTDNLGLCLPEFKTWLTTAIENRENVGYLEFCRPDAHANEKVRCFRVIGIKYVGGKVFVDVQFTSNEFGRLGCFLLENKITTITWNEYRTVHESVAVKKETVWYEFAIKYKESDFYVWLMKVEPQIKIA